MKGNIFMADEKIVITEDMTIADAIELKPSIVEVLDSIGMHCLHCAIAFGETIGDAVEHHELDKEKFLEMLNKD